jgi:hypothetical protein
MNYHAISEQYVLMTVENPHIGRDKIEGFGVRYSSLGMTCHIWRW